MASREANTDRDACAQIPLQEELSEEPLDKNRIAWLFYSTLNAYNHSQNTQTLTNNTLKTCGLTRNTYTNENY